MPRHPVRALAALATAVALAASGCESATQAQTAPPAPDASQWAGARYTALGDSYTTGAGLGTLQPGDLAAACLRTEANYPSRLAEALGMRLDDRSCGSARSDDVLAPRGDRPAQILGVDADTDLVTLRVGANDGDLFQIFFSECTALALDDPDGAPCARENAAELPAIVEETGSDVVDVLQSVRERAPGATVLLVGYSQLVSPEGACPDVPFSIGDLAWISESEELLDRTLAAAAEVGGAEYVSLRDASEGSDLCAGPDSWINDLQPGPNAGVALHPNRGEVAAVLELLNQILADTDRS